MTSHELENVHLELLNKLLTDSGIECLRPIAESTESILSEGESVEIGKGEEEELPQEVEPEEEEISTHIEEIAEELPAVFPTPSLRRVISDKLRKIEEYNRIHVLPDEFNDAIDPQAIPKIATTPQQKYIEIIADLVGCKMYGSSIAEYWFLDTMANLLRRAQEDDLDRPTQAVLMLWFCEWMKEIQHFDAADRQRMLKRFKDNMLAAAKYITETEQLPTPAEAGVYYEAQEEKTDSKNFSPSMVMDSKLVTFEGTGYGCSMVDLTKILHYIYDLFSTDYQYDLIRSIFTHTPDYILIDAPYQIQNPKKIYVHVKTKPKKDLSKKAERPVSGKGRKKSSSAELEDYNHLLQIKAREERYLDEQEEIEREAWNRKSHILPLSFSVSADEEFFNKYWPPPPPPPPSEPEPKPEPVSKGRKGKR